MNILIINSYTWYNKGDASIVKGMIVALNTYFNEPNIKILSFTPKIDKQYYNTHVYENLLNPYPYKQGFMYKIDTILKLLNKIIRFMSWHFTKQNGILMKEEQKIVKCYLDADIILGCGGGYLGGSNPGMLLHFFSLLFGKLVGKEVLLTGVSINYTHNIIYKILLKITLKNIDLITIRENASLQYLGSLNLNKKYYLTADYAFLVNPIAKQDSVNILKDNMITPDTVLIGFTVRNWNFPQAKSTIKNNLFRNYISSITNAIEYILENIKSEIVFFPQVIFSPKDDDRTINKLIYENIDDKYKEHIKILTNDFTPEELKGIIGLMDVFIGTRMHSNIFSLSEGVPTIAISYEIKTLGIMSDLNMDEYVIDINEITTEQLIMTFTKVFKNRYKIKRHLLNNKHINYEKALKNGKLIYNHYYKSKK